MDLEEEEAEEVEEVDFKEAEINLEFLEVEVNILDKKYLNVNYKIFLFVLFLILKIYCK